MKEQIIMIANHPGVMYFKIVSHPKNISFLYELYNNQMSAWIKGHDNSHSWVVLKELDQMSEEELFQESLVNDVGVCVYLLAKIQVVLPKEYDNLINNMRVYIDY